MKKKIAIHTHKLMGFLSMKGFSLLGIEQNKKNTKLNVYIFNDSEEIQEAIKEYKQFMDNHRHVFERDLSK